ncbi:hypothetical protein KKA14_07330 [bacterium]|nr:hypothetical protein [bacterium]
MISIKQTTRAWLLIIFLHLFTTSLFAQEIKTYHGSVTVPILENDIAFAKNNAFLTSQRQLLSAAIKDLIGERLFDEYQTQIYKRKIITPSDYLVSVIVLKEESVDGNFNMEMEGKIQTTSLAEALRKMNLVLSTDSRHSITLLRENIVKIPIERLRERLDLFHIDISQVEIVELAALPLERTKKEFIESLFVQFPDSSIIFLIDAVPDESQQNVKEIRTTIFRKSGFEKLNSFSLNFSSHIPITELEERLQQDISKFLLTFSIHTLSQKAFDKGLEATVYLEISGLIDPYIRSVFEKRFLDPNRAIKSYHLTRLSSDVSNYRLQSSASIKTLANYFDKKNPYFYFLIDESGLNTLNIESFYRLTETVTELNKWEPKEQIIKMINETFETESLFPNDDLSKDNPDPDELNIEHIPTVEENEPNDNARNLNFLPSATIMLGKISSRADEDVFKLNRQVESSTLVINWKIIGKTALSPQLRLYDKNFDFLNSYSLIGSQKKLTFRNTFPNNTPKELYLRISDKIGFIQGETGGFKSFYYLLDYHWQVEEATKEFEGETLNH